MKNYGHSLWVSVYELFIEFFGGLLPGAFFSTYFVLCAIFLTSSFGDRFTDYWHIIIIGMIAISYAMGAIFRASNMRGPDIESARYIYFHSTPTDDNAFAFVQTMSNEEYQDLVNSIEQNSVLSSVLKLNFTKLRLRKKRTGRNLRNLKVKSIPYCLRKIYKRALRKKKRIQITRRIQKNADIKSKELEHLIDKLLPYVSFSVDYPYYNLKQYFADRGMKSYANKVSWKYSATDNKTTARSKSFICKMKLELRNNPDIDISLVTKSEANIRFMNAMWYAAKNLNRISSIVATITSLILILRAIIYFLADQYSLTRSSLLTSDFSALRFPELETNTFLLTIVRVIQRILYYIQLIVESKDLFIIFVISVVYLFFCHIILCAIKNNFHYQRVREITYLFQSHQLLKESSNEGNGRCSPDEK